MNGAKYILGLLLVSLAACGGGGGADGAGGVAVNSAPPTSNTAIVLGANDLGMHCMDREFSIFSILPPFNVTHSQVIIKDANGKPVLVSDADVTVTYGAIVDPAGSINSRSIGKTNFWQYSNNMFLGVLLNNGEGLTGLYMPEDHPQTKGPQSMAYTATEGLFTAFGIPITPLDDAMTTNPYPLLRIRANNKQTGSQIGYLDVVVPVATETNCQTCHRTGGIASTRAGITWAADADIEVQAKKNVLKLHDMDQATNLEASTPVLCAQCHYSPALDLAGQGPTPAQQGKPTFSAVMHKYHGTLTSGGNPVFPPAGTMGQTCYQCHPGDVTQCLRGAMHTAGINCNGCHGNMDSVGGTYPLLAGGSTDGTNDGNPRRPWRDLPRCQSCHTGDAVSYLTGVNLVADPTWPFRLQQAYKTGDLSASSMLATNKRFAENTNTLYRFSKGHSNVACENCHGSTHAEWPNAIASANDNLASIKLQGYVGKIMECTACHRAGSLPRTTNGPHGLHNINDSRWYNDGHENFYENDPNSCRACHGLTLAGTPLARVPVARSFTVDGQARTFAKGDLVRCDKCHGMP